MHSTRRAVPRITHLGNAICDACYANAIHNLCACLSRTLLPLAQELVLLVAQELVKLVAMELVLALLEVGVGVLVAEPVLAQHSTWSPPQDSKLTTPLSLHSGHLGDPWKP